MMITDHPACSCIGHRMPGVFHVIACCDQPHVDSLFYEGFIPSCQYEYEIWDECGDDSVVYTTGRGWLCRYHAKHFGVI